MDNRQLVQCKSLLNLHSVTAQTLVAARNMSDLQYVDEQTEF